MPDPATSPVDVVGVVGGEVFGAAARHAVAAADVLVGSSRHLAWFGSSSPGAARVELTGPLPPLIEAMAVESAAGRRVCLLSSGDPGFFGITRLMSERFGPARLRIHPAPSSVSLAWAAAGRSWDDATVVSAHGRSLDDAVDLAIGSTKVAVLTSPTSPPEAVGKELLRRGAEPRTVVVASRLGEHDQQIVETDLDGLATGTFDPMSVVLLIGSDAASEASISWGRHEREFAHRDGMITKSEVRAVVLSKLELPRRGVLWDVGAGSGSVGIEAATVAPGVRVHAVEQAPADAERIIENARRAGVGARVAVVVGRAPEVLAELPAPSRVFVGGGGLDVVRRCWDRLAPGGVLVATFVLMDRAVVAHQLLGQMVQVHVDRAVAIGGVGIRLEPSNPVFICWGAR